MRKTSFIVVAVFLMGAAAGYMFAPSGPTNQPALEGDEKEVLYWVAPMDPNFRRDGPGKSPMGMDLVPVYAGGATTEEQDALQINASVVNNIGVRTSFATRSDLSRSIDTVGFVAVDETKTSHVHVRTAGWVEKLYRKAVGEPVSKGEVIFELYSPELVTAQAEYLQAIRLGNDTLIKAGLGRLRALGMTAQDLAKLKQTRTPIERIAVTAPQDGIIMALNVGEGMHITPGNTVFSLADLSTIWVKADVFEAKSGWVAEGQNATITLAHSPSSSWTGVVDYIYPNVDPQSRTVPVRLVVDNPEMQLKPNMYAEVSIAVDLLENALSIPREALIRTGKTDRVILALGGGSFRAAEVLAGAEVGDRVVIVDGLREGETVVTSGQFLLDSEASLNASFLRLLSEQNGGLEEEAPAEEEEVHHGMAVVEALKSDGVVTLTHEPIPSLDWPAMTMDFAVASDVDVSVFEVGDTMHFMFKQQDGGLYVIVAAMKM